jgi:heavy metal sensor kinase
VRRRNIRVELTIVYSIVMALTLLAVGFSVERLSYNRISASIDATLRRYARGVINTVDELGAIGITLGQMPHDTSFSVLNPPPWPPRYVQLLDAMSSVAYRSRNLGGSVLPVDTTIIRESKLDMVISPDMKLYMYKSRNGHGAVPIETVEVTRRGDPSRLAGEAVPHRTETLRMITFPLRAINGKPLGWGQVAISLHELERTKKKNRLALAFILPPAIVLSAVVGWWMARTVLTPIDEMASKARRIGSESLHERIDVPNVNDELSRLAATLNGLLGRLEESFSHMRRFSSDVSHELRTPLTVIRGEAEVALRPDSSQEDMRRALEVIEDESVRLSQLVKNLLTLARLESGQSRIELIPVDLVHVAEDLAEQAGALAEAKGLRFRLGLAEEATVMGDPVMLRQIGFNLIHNAVKYTPSGGKVELDLTVVEKRAYLTVSDTGIGITDEEKKHIFKRFYRSDRVRNDREGGSGLGLPLVKQIVEIHDGTIEVTSTPGECTTFVVMLPLLDPDTEPERDDQPGKPSRGKTIL